MKIEVTLISKCLLADMDYDTKINWQCLEFRGCFGDYFQFLAFSKNILHYICKLNTAKFYINYSGKNSLFAGTDD